MQLAASIRGADAPASGCPTAPRAPTMSLDDGRNGTDSPDGASSASLAALFGKARFKGVGRLFRDGPGSAGSGAGSASVSPSDSSASLNNLRPFKSFSRIRDSAVASPDTLTLAGSADKIDNSTTSSDSATPRVSVTPAGHLVSDYEDSCASSGGESESESGHHQGHPADILQRYIEREFLERRSRKLRRPRKDRSQHGHPTACISVRHKPLSYYGEPVRKIGEGASGSVTECRTKDAQVYAIKLYRTPDTPPQQSQTQHSGLSPFQRIIIREYCVGSLFEHQNIMRTIDLVFEIDQRSQDIVHMIQVMEYVPYDFFNVVSTGAVTPAEAACYLKQLANGVAYLHSMEIAHRDIKLDNCVVSSSGIVKIIDFGSAVVFWDGPAAQLIPASGIVGSDPYLAPELLAGHSKAYDPRAVDVWALAIMYYCLIMGKFPWKAPRRSYNNFRLFSEDPDDEDDVSKGPLRVLRLLPADSHHLLGGMLELEPRRRITASQMLADPWLASVHCCEEDRGGHLVHAPTDHTHHLVSQDEIDKTTAPTPA